MNVETSDPLHRRAVRFATAAGTFGALGAGVVLLGWVFDIAVLKQPLPAAASMKPNTALALLLTGVSLRLFASGRHARVTAALGLGVSLLGLVTLGQDLLGRNLGIDQLLFADTDAAGTSAPGRMAPATALCLMALGMALATGANQAPAWLTQAPSIVAMLVSAAAALGYAYDINALYGAGPYTTMAVHTASILLLLSLGVLCARPALGIMAPAFSSEMEGSMTRRFLLAGFLVPVLLGWFLLQAQRAGLHRPEFSVALMALLTVILLSIVIWRNAGTLGRLRTASESALRSANEGLEYEVARQTKELARREREFRLVVEEAHEGFVAMDSTGRIVELNSRTESMFGWSRDDIMGRHVSDVLIPPRYREAHRLGLRGFVAGGEGTVLDREIEIEALHRDGHEFPVMLTISAVWFDDQWRFNAFIRDLTQPKAAEELLMDALSEKETLLTEVHHRVKNNLQVISSFLRLQSRATKDSAAVDALRQSEDRVLSMALLHENLYRRGNPGRVDFDRYVRALVIELLRTYKSEHDDPAVTVDVDFSGLDIEKAVPLGLLLNELITNALKHAFVDGRTGHISVELSRNGGSGMLRVRDDGVGFRVPAAEPPASVGLQIIGALSRQLGGRGQFRSDGGTEFTLEFPVT